MKEKQGVNAIVVLIMGIIFLVVGIIFGEYLYGKNIFKMFKENSKTEVKTDEDEKENSSELSSTSLKGKKYVLNLKNDEYIYFIDDKNYEYKHYNSSYTDSEISKGTYEFSDNKVKLDGENDAIIEDNRLILIDKSEFKLIGDKVYYDPSIIVEEFSKISDAMKKHIYNQKSLDSNLASIKKIVVNVRECGKNEKGNLACSIEYDIYFPESENYSASACEKEYKFYAYSPAVGSCDQYKLGGGVFYELSLTNDSYTIISAYSG